LGCWVFPRRSKGSRKEPPYQGKHSRRKKEKPPVRNASLPRDFGKEMPKTRGTKKNHTNGEKRRATNLKEVGVPEKNKKTKRRRSNRALRPELSLSFT